MTALKQLLLSGGLLRIGKPYGAHIEKGGRVLPVDDADVEKAIRTGLVRPNGRDQFGRYLFAMGNQKNVQLLRQLPSKPSVPAIQPGLPVLRGESHPGAGKDATRGNGMPGQTAGMPSSVGGAGPRRRGNQEAGQGCGGDCAGCSKNKEVKKEIAA